MGEPTTNEDTVEVLLFLARAIRLSSLTISDLSQSVNALIEIVVGDNKALRAQFEAYQDEAGASFEDEKKKALGRLDAIIVKLESQRPPHVS